MSLDRTALGRYGLQSGTAAEALETALVGREVVSREGLGALEVLLLSAVQHALHPTRVTTVALLDHFPWSTTAVGESAARALERSFSATRAGERSPLARANDAMKNAVVMLTDGFQAVARRGSSAFR